MVFEAAHLVVVGGVLALLEVQHVDPVGQRAAAVEQIVEDLTDVVVVLHVEGLKAVGIPHGVKAQPPRLTGKAEMHGLRQPDAVGVDLPDSSARPLPEVQRDEACHVAAEAVHDGGPEAQGLDLVVPEPGVRVVQVNDVGPVAVAVAGSALGVVVEKLRVRLIEHRVRRGVVIYHIDHDLHAARVDLVHQLLEVLQRAVGGVYAAVVPVCVGAAEAPLLPLNADGVDGHEPDDVRPEGADAVQIGDNGAEGPLRGMRADIYGVNDLRL